MNRDDRELAYRSALNAAREDLYVIDEERKRLQSRDSMLGRKARDLRRAISVLARISNDADLLKTAPQPPRPMAVPDKGEA